MDLSPVPPLPAARERAPYAAVGPLVPAHLTGALINNPDFRVTLRGPAWFATPRPWYQPPTVGGIESPLAMETRPRENEPDETTAPPPAAALPAPLAAPKPAPPAFPAPRAVQSILDIF